MDTTRDLLVRLEAEHELSREEWINLIDNRTNEDESYAAARARDVARGHFERLGRDVDCVHARLRERDRAGDRDAARTRADVDPPFAAATR